MFCSIDDAPSLPFWFFCFFFLFCPKPKKSLHRLCPCIGRHFSFRALLGSAARLLSLNLSAASGLLLTSGGEACRHTERQGAATPAAAARAANSAAQQRLHLGKPGRPGDPHTAVFGCKCRSHAAAVFFTLLFLCGLFRSCFFLSLLAKLCVLYAFSSTAAPAGYIHH